MSPQICWLVTVCALVATDWVGFYISYKLAKRVGKLEREQLRLYRAISRILAGELPRRVEP